AQLVAGYAAIANGGTLVTPHVVAGWTDVGGTYHDATPEPAGRVMREETAKTVLTLLTGAIDDGIAQAAKVPGYAIAGKTGTAQIAGPVVRTVVDGHDAQGRPIYKKVTVNEYIDGWIDSSFIGVYPASNPRVATLILLHRPATWGRYKMAERPDQVFGELAPQILDYLAIPPDRPGASVAAR
ncbi:MAG TPA: penicillin-binding transpeptidase domain-containing protein, partial [Candidatus Limnocylindria bacterium]|nr:penicillin-binding transpeptidase domain-containing protein [Candidatus Limnocylindria bacterium]